ncbi:MAG: HigA family addiction module antitoxin [Wenzhouxiangella sp.]|jgi:addiction module HigA family antidote|nr:HigA family addiction module antitoxin [Wenzhouxiangella sp.]
MPMYNPPHPGEFIKEMFLEPYGITARQLAIKLAVAPSTLTRILNGQAGISAEMAVRLSKALGPSPESWIQMQVNHALWHAKRSVNLDEVEKINFKAA